MRGQIDRQFGADQEWALHSLSWIVRRKLVAVHEMLLPPSWKSPKSATHWPTRGRSEAAKPCGIAPHVPPGELEFGPTQSRVSETLATRPTSRGPSPLPVVHDANDPKITTEGRTKSTARARL
jgi:hypothetical protein